MKTVLLLFAIIAHSTVASAKSIDCFSKFYGANNFTINISADVAANDTLANVQVIDAGDSFDAKMETLKSFSGNHRATGTYANYQDFLIKNGNETKFALGTITLLLPKNLGDLDGRFTAFASDPNADNSGSDGYQKLLCHTK